MDVDDTGTHCGAAEVLDLADVTLDFPQRSLSRRTFREGTPDGTIERLPNIRNLATETADLLELSSQPVSPLARPSSPSGGVTPPTQPHSPTVS